MLFFLWISVERKYMFMKDNISERKEFISFKIINPITLLTKRITSRVEQCFGNLENLVCIQFINLREEDAYIQSIG